MLDCLALRNIASLAFVMAVTMASIDINVFFPDINGNLTKITWAHAVDNMTYLKATLSDENVMMIEADVVLGLLDGRGELQPVMAHPPDNISDLSLRSFFLEVSKFNKNETNTGKKGVKLDFKSIDAFKTSAEIVNEYDKGEYPIWINADIIPGPINANTTAVDPDQFFSGSKSFPNSVLSIGWTTRFGSGYSGSYESEQIQNMLDAITRNNVTQDITFPVRAGLAAESVDLLTGLVDDVKNSTLTIWSSEGDNVNVDHLRQLIAKIGISKVYIDVPSDLLKQLHLDDLPNSSVGINLSTLGAALSILLGIINYYKF